MIQTKSIDSAKPNTIECTIENLVKYHNIWNQRLVEKKIFSQPLQLPNFQVKYGVKSYCGKWIPKTNTIVLYPKTIVDIYWFQSVLVHEMIHQYITENKIIDNSSHGYKWKAFAITINSHFYPELDINVTGDKPIEETEGNQIYKIVALCFKDNKCYMCVVHPSSVGHINAMIMTRKFKWKSPLVKFGWFESKNTHFSKQQQNKTRLTGEGIRISELHSYIEKFNLKRIQVVEEL